MADIVSQMRLAAFGKVEQTQTVKRWDDTRLIYEVHLKRAVEIVKAQLYVDGAILNQSNKKKTK